MLTSKTQAALEFPMNLETWIYVLTAFGVPVTVTDGLLLYGYLESRRLERRLKELGA